jgi:putative oxidoreductase
MKLVLLLGRILFSLVFIFTIMSHFSSEAISYGAANNVPIPSILVPLSGIVACLGGLSILIGYKARAGAWLIVIFLVPVTLMMHQFWMVTDPMMKQMQMANFFKNAALIGSSLMIAYFGAGPVSVDAALGSKITVKYN